VTEPFNPLGMENLGSSVAAALLAADQTLLTDVPAFYGAGVYAIYYHGPLDLYAPLAAAGANGAAAPIYVGKAVPRGGRKGTDVEHGTRSRALVGRLREHANSIEAATDLEKADFSCRWLVVEPIWIPLGESVIISRFAPVWNVIVDGFGNHDPGVGRIAGMRTRWDTLHPGRARAENYPARPETAADIAVETTEYLAQRYQI